MKFFTDRDAASIRLFSAYDHIREMVGDYLSETRVTTSNISAYFQLSTSQIQTALGLCGSQILLEGNQPEKECWKKGIYLNQILTNPDLVFQIEKDLSRGLSF
jgi:hypothetical protein